ncbi:hypothetical protein [Polaribacter sp.]|uniref:hypothetical protein n=1 Tax=Polaribacter sp. TaxID=1920175 RepID=UPI003F6CD2B4
MKLKLILILSFISLQNFFAQEKFEKEYRVKEKEVPKLAAKILQQWNFPKKVKWYAEESNLGKTFEAKTCFNKHKYSFEFNEKGEILDVEKKVKLKSLSIKEQQVIEKVLTKIFKKYRIKKIQIQYSGSENAIYKQIFQLNTTQQKPVIKYEIVVKGKKDNKKENFEILINQQGKIEQLMKIKSILSLNLEF